MTPEWKNDSELYGSFAEIYDRIMCSVDYDGWADYVEDLLNKNSKEPLEVVDLACGTGSSTLPFAHRGYLAAGVDISERMLKLARQKSAQDNLQVGFFQQDLRYLTLPKRFDLALLFQDGLNYILNEEELYLALNNINKILNPGGLFIFDLTRPGLRYSRGRESICSAEFEEFILIMESSYRADEELWSARLTVFQEIDNGLYRRYREEHLEKDYDPELVTRLLEQAGFIVCGIHPSFRFEQAKTTDQKLTFVAEKKS